MEVVVIDAVVDAKRLLSGNPDPAMVRRCQENMWYWKTEQSRKYIRKSLFCVYDELPVYKAVVMGHIKVTQQDKLVIGTTSTVPQFQNNQHP